MIETVSSRPRHLPFARGFAADGIMPIARTRDSDWSGTFFLDKRRKLNRCNWTLGAKETGIDLYEEGVDCCPHGKDPTYRDRSAKNAARYVLRLRFRSSPAHSATTNTARTLKRSRPALLLRTPISASWRSYPFTICVY